MSGRPVVVLVGLPGAGKTTIGRKLARRLGLDFHDTDQLVEERAGRGIPEIFATEGEAGFRALEEDVVGRALEEAGGVLSLGGGSVLSERTRRRLRDHLVVHLTIGVVEGVRRSQGGRRPLLDVDDPVARYQRLHTDRSPLYREVATESVTTERRSSGKVVSELVDLLTTRMPHLRVAAEPDPTESEAPDADPAHANPAEANPADVHPAAAPRDPR